jgi:hypothetical protein
VDVLGAVLDKRSPSVVSLIKALPPETLMIAQSVLIPDVHDATTLVALLSTRFFSLTKKLTPVAFILPK